MYREKLGILRDIIIFHIQTCFAKKEMKTIHSPLFSIYIIAFCTHTYTQTLNCLRFCTENNLLI